MAAQLIKVSIRPSLPTIASKAAWHWGPTWMSHRALAVGSPFARAGASAASAASALRSMIPTAEAPSSTTLRARRAPRPDPPPTMTTARSFMLSISSFDFYGRRGTGGHDVQPGDVGRRWQSEQRDDHVGDVSRLDSNVSRVHCLARFRIEDVLVKLRL